MNKDVLKPNKLSAEREAATLAALAVQILPRMELPQDWQSKHPHTLESKLLEDLKPTGGCKLLSLYEIVANAAVKRARIVLEAARGEKMTLNEQLQALALRTRNEQDGQWAAQRFAELSPTGKPFLLSHLLKKVLPSKTSTKVVNAFVNDFQLKHKFPATIQNADGVLAPHRAAKAHWKKRKDALRKNVQRDSGVKGAKMKEKLVKQELGVYAGTMGTTGAEYKKSDFD